MSLVSIPIVKRAQRRHTRATDDDALRPIEREGVKTPPRILAGEFVNGMGIGQCGIYPRRIGQRHAGFAPIPITFFGETLRVGRYESDAIDPQHSQRLPDRLGGCDHRDTRRGGGGQLILARGRHPIARTRAAVAEGGEIERAELRERLRHVVDVVIESLLDSCSGMHKSSCVERCAFGQQGAKLGLDGRIGLRHRNADSRAVTVVSSGRLYSQRLSR